MNETLKSRGLPPMSELPDSLNSARFVQEMPSIVSPLLMDVFELFGVLLFPISMNLQIPPLSSESVQ